MNSALRILDANANRAREALRVLEDCARFAADDQALSAALKALRHDLAAALSLLPMQAALQTRDTPGDVGTTNKTAAEFQRPALADVLAANAKRLTEALRSLEECAKLVAPAKAPTSSPASGAGAAVLLEQLRYRAYTLEQSLMACFLAASAQERFRRVRLYVLLTESLCSRSWEAVLDDILAAGSVAGETSPSASALCIQLREKTLSDAELLRRARIVAEKCHAAGALTIINDRPDIAVLASADGVHVGQGDLPLPAVRRILPPESIVGISTENLEQARAALADGPTYIAVGPMFPTTTKHKPRIAGPAYAAAAAGEIYCPLVAIGGITPDNLPAVLATGVRTVAVSAAVLRSGDPAATTREMLAVLRRFHPDAEAEPEPAA